MIYSNILELIHNTPIIKLISLENAFLKLEYFNPMGSIKDRTAIALVNDLRKRQGNFTIVEASSGNTAIALAYISNVLKIPLIIIMPENMSEERKKILRIFDVKLILSPKADGMQGAIALRDKLVNEHDTYVSAEQFTNLANPKVHQEYTADEILKDFDNLDVLVVPVGTGGTITGLSRTLKRYFRNLKVVAVEPSAKKILADFKDEVYFLGERDSENKIQGIGAGFIPDLLDLALIDSVSVVSNMEAYSGVKELARQEGLLLGLSSGAVFKTMQFLYTKYKDKKILGIAPDSGERYLSVF